VVDAVLVGGEGEPSWIIVRRTGRHPARTAVPPAGSSRAPGRVIVPYDRPWLDAAPRIGTATAPGAEHERELSRFYGLAPSREPRPQHWSAAPTATRARIELWDPEGARRAWLTWGLEDAAWAAGLQAPLEPGPPSPGLPPDADTIGGDSVSTGLNRPYTPQVARARRSNRPLSLVLADLDGLKRVNDQLGHGDLYLRAAARRLTESARQGDVCFRWGGDEFAVVLPEADVVGAEQVLRRVAGAFGRLEDATLQLSCASATLWEGASGDDLLRRADARLVASKRSVGTP